MSETFNEDLLGVIKTLAAEIHHDDFVATEQIAERWFEENPEFDFDQVTDALIALEEQGAIKSVTNETGDVVGYVIVHA
jgi:Fe2+ or Zn2+ uptake regulation protein